MGKTLISPWFRGTAALAVGVLLGALALNLWTQRCRYRELGEALPPPRPQEGRYAGSASCRECHQRFYDLWSPSHHGQAMQPVTAELVQTRLSPLAQPLAVGAARFSVDLSRLEVVEEHDGARTAYPMQHAMGGKNMFFFLTPRERGRLQVLPVAYDLRRQEWFDTTGAMVRHFADQPDAPVHWRDPLLTFNTACYNCHVSQLDKNYDPQTDTYHTAWREPGINCEACHGPGQEHNRVCRAVPEGTVPKDLRTIRWRQFTTDQTNDACAPCHAKMRPVAPAFMPGARFFDHYDLACLEDRDFYPDGRDLGENYTHTLWLMNPCVQSGLLDCVHCHTSSGRFRQKEQPSTACVPCHAQRVRRLSEHSHHPATANAPTCVSCHLPMTEFSRMRRSDHSFRPPCPQASIRFGSPNACLLCHTSQSNDWAAARVHEWHPHGHWQDRILREGGLIEAARKGQWETLPDILAYVQAAGSDPVVVTSLVRLLGQCRSPDKWPAVRASARHPSPLVRGAAMAALDEDLSTAASVQILLAALRDDVRLVRCRAAAALAALPREGSAPEHQAALAKAEAELLASFAAQPDDWSAHYNRGIYYEHRGDASAALAGYAAASKLRPDVVPPWVNASVLHARLGQTAQAEQALGRALAAEPANPQANFNYGLLLAEKGDLAAAERALRTALKADPAMAPAAYNLGVLLAADRLAEALVFCRQAYVLVPAEAKYAYTLAFYLAQSGDAAGAVRVLQEAVARRPASADPYVLLIQLLRKQGQADAARQIGREALANPALAPQDRAAIEAMHSANGPESSSGWKRSR